MGKKKDYTNKELAEAHIYPNDLSEEDLKRAQEEFSSYRMNRTENMTQREKVLSRLLQLKYMMDDYLQSNEYKAEWTFGFFLDKYMESVFKDPSTFSNEISVRPFTIKQLIQNQKIPNDKILFRLDLHSNHIISALTWCRVLEKQKESDIIQDEEEMRKSESPFVKKMNLDLV